jgi:hypothetical protein
MLQASLATKTHIIWDLCHRGVPDNLDIFSDEFVTRFAAFAGAAAEIVSNSPAASKLPSPSTVPSMK